MNKHKLFKIPLQLSILTGLSLFLTECFLPSQAHAYTVNDYYNICLIAANSRGCESLAQLCRNGNGRACRALYDIGDRGYRRIQGYCDRRSQQACQFKRAVDRIGVSNLGQACQARNYTACRALDTVRCYATESATGNQCVGGFRY